MDLRAYERVKFELAEILNTLPRDAAQFQRRLDLFARLAEDRFNLVVVGRFSRGKSSLMNAILGMDRLPTGVVPLTSVITTVTYGSEERVTLHFRGSGLIEDIQLDQLADYVTERGNPGNARRIEVAEVQLPAPILRHGFHFVDTPGLGSSIAENSRATEAFMPEADALILVTSFDSPLSEEEIAVLRSARRLRRRVFLAVNKQDAVTAAEQAEVLAHVAGQVRSVFGADRQEVFPLSARNALTAKLAANRVGLAASGVPGLEQALIGFLVSGRRQEFLLAMCARVGEMVAPDAGAVAHLDALRASIVTPGSRVIPAVHTEQELASDIPPCEVCVRIEIAIADFMMGYQARLGRDPAARTELAERRGLCGTHASQFEKVAAPREVCAAFARVLESQAARLRSAAAGKAALLRDAVEQMLPDARHCPVCEVAAAARAKATALVASSLAAAGSATPPRFPAICLPHLPAVLATLKDGPARDAFLSRQADILERFADDMRRFALKQDAARGWAFNKEELGAAHRGSRALVGAPAAFIPPGGRLDSTGADA
jgi:GTP-binding protein EngB required for normal cell division